MKPVTEKIKKLTEIGDIAASLKKQGKKVVLCHGVFDLIHAGHIRHLHAARREGDALIVSVTPDKYVNRGPDRPVFPQELRAEVLASLDAVDYAVINMTATATEMIRAVKPNVYVKGSDYKDRSMDVTGKIYEEEDTVAEFGGKIVFTEDITFSSSTLANNFFNRYSEEAQAYLKGFRQKLSGDALVAKINGVSPRKVLVLGDAIIDEYHYVTPLGKSPKENVIVTKYETEEIFAGGGLAAANHVASLCDEVDLVTCVGADDGRESLFKSHLKKNIRQRLFQRNDAPTIVKRRFVEQNYNQKLFQICFINNSDLPEETEKQILDHLNKTIPDYDLVLVTDFGHGLLTPKIIDLVCKKARFLAVNAQSNSANHGFNLITKYPRADFICIDEPEIRLALHDRRSPLETMIKRLSGQLDARSVIITHGNHGCVAFSKDEGLFKIPVFTRTVVDTIGAGDAFLSISAPCVASGLPIEECAFIGNAAGALKVGIVGNRSSIDKAPLLKYITTLLK